MKILIEALTEFKRQLPDRRIKEINTLNDLSEYIATPVPIYTSPGNPREDLFDGQELPPNVRTVTAHKGFLLEKNEIPKYLPINPWAELRPIPKRNPFPIRRRARE